MIRENCCYDPAYDFQAVDQKGFVDLVKAHETGSIPANISGAEEEYNGVEEPESLIGTPSDVFDATRKAKQVVAARAKAAEAAAVTSGEAE